MDQHYIKDLKKAYRILRKEKNEYKKGDEKRIELHKKMKDIKQKIHKASGGNMDPQKQILIDKIIEFKTANRMSITDMNKFSISELDFHYMKITGQVNTKDEYNKIKGIVVESDPEPISELPESESHSPIETAIRRIKRKDAF